MAEKDHADIITYPPLIYVGAILIGWTINKYVMPWENIGAEGKEIIGYGIMGLGLFIILVAALSFKKSGQNPDPHTPTPSIYTGGIFGITRNPMYIGMGIITLGASVLINTYWIIIFLGPALVLVHFGVIKKEEEYLIQKFGNEYLDYLKNVRRWL